MAKNCGPLRIDLNGKRLKRGDKVTVIGGFLPGSRAQPGVITGWPGCQIAEVRMLTRDSWEKPATHAVDVGYLVKRKRRR